MDSTYLWILYYPINTTIVIKLTNDEIKRSEQYDSFENFMREELEDKYNFVTDDCAYMLADEYNYERRGF